MAEQIRANPSDPHRDLQLARAAAIEAYSDLEQQLCLQFADLIGANFHRASLVFYRITSSHSRNRIIQSLLKDEYGDQYDKFWRSVIRLIRQLDQTRNQIVHWHILVGQFFSEAEEVEEEAEDAEMDAVLAPHGDSEEVVMTASDLWDFVDKTEFVRLQAMMFHILHLSRPSLEDQKTDKQYEVFQRSVIYPPPENYYGFHFGPLPKTNQT